MLKLTDSFLKKGIAVIEFYAKNLMYELASPDAILYKIHISHVTEACFTNMKGAQNTGEVWAVYLK